jgi:arylsulfatase
MYRRLDELGTPKTQPLYQRPWAMASNTPFQYYKLWPYRGGTNTPFIVSWPSQIKTHGLRRQFVDIIDITPTVLDITGTVEPAMFEGVCQIPMQGKSIRATFGDPAAPNPRGVQYFELWGSRAIWADGWSAVAAHKPGADFETDRWKLYHVDEDFSESEDVAARHPERLAEMKKLWWSEAAKAGALPQLEAPALRQHTYDQALEPGRD